jgi:hypothetical protein
MGRGRSKSKVVSLLFIIWWVWGLSACSLIGGGDDEAAQLTLGSEGDLVPGSAALICSQECRDRGFCGIAEQGTMVLLSSFGPATRGHDMAVLDRTTVNIEFGQPQTAFTVLTNEPVPINYYAVNVPERGSGWVAGWCIGQ